MFDLLCFKCKFVLTVTGHYMIVSGYMISPEIYYCDLITLVTNEKGECVLRVVLLSLWNESLSLECFGVTWLTRKMSCIVSHKHLLLYKTIISQC